MSQTSQFTIEPLFISFCCLICFVSTMTTVAYPDYMPLSFLRKKKRKMSVSRKDRTKDPWKFTRFRVFGRLRCSSASSKSSWRIVVCCQFFWVASPSGQISYLVDNPSRMLVRFNVTPQMTLGAFAESWLEGLGEYEVVIPQRVTGRGKPLPSGDAAHFPRKHPHRARRSAGTGAASGIPQVPQHLQKRFPGIYGANNPDYVSEEELPGDRLDPASSEEGRHMEGETRDSSQLPGQQQQTSLNSRKDTLSEIHGNYRYSSDRNIGVHDTQNNRLDNRIHPIDSGEVRHSYSLPHANFDQSGPQWDNHIDTPDLHGPRTNNKRTNNSSGKSNSTLAKGHLGNSLGETESHEDFMEDSDFWREAHYSLQAFGRQFDLHLEPNLDFLSSGVVIQHLDTNRTWLSDSADVGLHCFHRGNVAGDPGSTVVLSICDHLVSVSASASWGWSSSV